jgi:putative redox protein
VIIGECDNPDKSGQVVIISQLLNFSNSTPQQTAPMSDITKITAQIGLDHYTTTLQNATRSIVADEPVELGGQDLGFAPNELLASALGACTCITVRMYADRKGWPLEQLHVEVTMERDGQQTQITRNIHMTGALDEEQRQRLLAIANKCPVHQTLTQPIQIDTIVAM